MDKLPDNIDSTNPPPLIIPYDNYYSTDSSVSVSRGYVRLKNDVGWVWRNPIYSPFFQNNNPHHNINNTQHHITPPEVNTVNKLKEPHFKDKNMGKNSIIHQNHSHPCPYIHPFFR